MKAEKNKNVLYPSDGRELRNHQAERLLNAKGVEVMPFRDRNGEIRGMTLIDHRTLCAFKASEVSRTYAATLVRMAQEEQTGSRRKRAPQQGAPIQQTGASRSRIS